MPKQIGKSQSLTTFNCILLTLFFLLPFIGCQNEIAVRPLDSTFDFDSDGVADSNDLDDDNDGIPDEIETTADLDSDKIGNHHDRDSDGDGIPDLIEATGVDKDGDGILDLWDEWEDENSNGLHDEYEIEPLVERKNINGKVVWFSHHERNQILVDQDGDGIPNFWDADSDNDGITDSIEIGATKVK